ncbi:Hypothetical predicted protein, partial [Paramuricea clavata]
MSLTKSHWIAKRRRTFRNIVDGSGLTLTRNATVSAAHAKKLMSTFLRVTQMSIGRTTKSGAKRPIHIVKPMVYTREMLK